MMKYKTIIVIIAVFFVGLTGVLYNLKSENHRGSEVILTEEETPPATIAVTKKPAKEPEKIIYVHICGEVVSPGVYKLLENSRVVDLIDAAGGFTKDAAENYVNQAEKLADGQKIYIPDEKEAKSITEVTGSPDSSEEDTGKVNINTADKDTLMTIPGIGQSKAGSIIKYREEKGSFKSIDEIKNIEGIKEGVFNKIKDFIKI